MIRPWIISLLIGVLLVTEVQAARHDVLSDKEVDDLRDAAQDGEARLRLYLKYAQERLAALEQVRTDPKITGRPQQIHDRLEDFVAVYDEMNDNVETFVGRREDIRKVLKAIIAADAEFQNKLVALKNAPPDDPDGAKAYEFVLTDAQEDLDGSIGDHRQFLLQEEEAGKHKQLVRADPGRMKQSPK
jgi:hypothetical protein